MISYCWNVLKLHMHFLLLVYISNCILDGRGGYRYRVQVCANGAVYYRLSKKKFTLCCLKGSLDQQLSTVTAVTYSSCYPCFRQSPAFKLRVSLHCYTISCVPSLNFFRFASKACVRSLALSFAFKTASNAALAFGSLRTSRALESLWNRAAGKRSGEEMDRKTENRKGMRERMDGWMDGRKK